MPNKTYKVLGVSASLRNARRGLGNKTLIEDINNLKNDDELQKYIEQEALEHLNHFADAGRSESKPFDELYRNLKKLKGNKGLSNSEIMLVTALWAAKEHGAVIDHVSLAEFFSEGKNQKNVDELKAKLLECDGILLSTPVYFGDRGSLSQSFINLIRNDAELKSNLAGKTYAGCAVGAKRNGGQETTLIYQLMDMVNCNMLGLGNDSDTTSQYGGTGLAGDIGTMPKDDYGLATAKGTGRRIARVTGMLKVGEDVQLTGPHKITFWILQDKDGLAVKYVQDMLKDSGQELTANIIDVSSKNIIRCLACDICPTHINVDAEYRCIIKNPSDDLKEMHESFIDSDAIIPVSYSPVDRDGLVSNYQRFVERTRYLRRGDYVFSDIITAPLVIEELGAKENLSIRMTTSMIRHHTVVSKPIISYQTKGQEINRDDVLAEFKHLNSEIRRMASSRISALASDYKEMKYNPVGYVLSVQKDKEDEKLQNRRKMTDNRIERAKEMAKLRLSKK